MEQNDKAYFLKELEFALLLSMRGVKELYGFKMSEAQAPEQASVYQTLFNLEKNKLISFPDGGYIKIDSELERILDCIKNTNKILRYYNNHAKYPDQCIYLGGESIFVSGCGTMSGGYRIKKVSPDKTAEEIYESGFHIKEILNDQTLFCEKEIENEVLVQAAGSLFKEAAREGNDKKNGSWAYVSNCITVMTAQSGKCIRQYLLMEDGLRDYFVVTNEKEVHIYDYSKRKVIDTLRKEIAYSL